MIRKKIAGALILGTCVTILSTGTAFASTGEGRLPMEPRELIKEEVYTTTIVDSGDTPVSIAVEAAPDYDPKVMEKQSQIDTLLFEEHKGEFEKKGFSITHTAPHFDGYVEVGITPYSQENADYLYEILGRDMVKVVEGQQAVTMELAADSELAATSEPAAASGPAVEMDAVNTTSARVDVAPEAKSSTFLTLVYSVGALLLAGAVFLVRKLALAKK